MKNTLLLLGAAILLFSCSQLKKETAKQNYDLSLDMQGFEDSTLFIVYSSDLKVNLDSGYLVDGKLSLTGSVEFPQYVKIHTLYQDAEASEYRRLLFWLENREISIIGTKDQFDQSTVIGSPLDKMHHEIDQELEALDIVRDSLLRSYRSESDPNSYIVETIDHYDSLRRDLILKYIQDHPNNEVCIRKLALYKREMTVDQLQSMFSKVDKKFHQYIHSQEIMNYISEAINSDISEKELIDQIKENQDFTSVD